MFGLSTKEILFKSIVNACRNCENTYKNSIIENLDGLKNADNGTSKKNAFVARRKYLDDVSNKVIDSFRLSSPTIFARIQLVLRSPSMCGLEGLNSENGFMAGSLFAVCYFAIKNNIQQNMYSVKSYSKRHNGTGSTRRRRGIQSMTSVLFWILIAIKASVKPR